MEKDILKFNAASIEQVLVLLSAIPVQGPRPVSAMSAVYNILTQPITEDKQDTKK